MYLFWDTYFDGRAGLAIAAAYTAMILGLIWVNNPIASDFLQFNKNKNSINL